MHSTKSVLVTGATGFIGVATVACLKQNGWLVTSAVRSHFESLECDQIHLDLNDPAMILSLEHIRRFDAIVHLGASIGLRDTTEAEMYAANVLATGCLVFLAKKWGASLVFASTAIVCGVKTEKIDASANDKVDTDYAKTKLLGEMLIKSSHVPYCILRIGGVFGLDGPNHLGLNQAIQGALSGVPPTQVGHGCALRNYIYVKDVALAIQFALSRDLRGTHFLAGSEVMSIGHMLQEICDAFLPGVKPNRHDGVGGGSQVILPSLELPKTRSFSEALLDIRLAEL